jgi:formylglycine-generating enzyme required for sulfatase activity
MKLFHKYGTRDIEIARAKREFFWFAMLGLLVVVFFSIMLLIGQLQPRLDDSASETSPQTPTEDSSATSPSFSQFRDRVETLTTRFQERRHLQEVNESDLESLMEAISLQRAIIDNRASEIASKRDLDKLDELLRLYDQEMGSLLAAPSREREQEARHLMDRGDGQAALAKLEEAIALQEEINRQHARSPDRDAVRLNALQSLRQEWITRPIHDDITALREQAQTSIAKADFGAARDSIASAMEKQRLLNQTHRTSRYASLMTLRDLESQWASLQTAEEMEEVQQLVQAAESALEQQDVDAAVRASRKARTVIETLSVEAPGQSSRFEPFLRQAAQVEQSAASLESFRQWKGLRDQIDQALRQQEFTNLQPLLSQWFRLTRDFLEQFPDSRFRTQLDTARVDYLHALRHDLASLVQSILANLLPVPGSPQTRLYKTEINQLLFERITDSNPSLNKNPELPVDSVTWSEAKDFADKLSWILGRPTRLPDLSTALAAVGEVDPARLRASTWHSLNANREPQPVGTSSVNQHGFHDLLGNVAEWLHADPSAQQVAAFGGSLRDSTARLAERPVEERGRGERNRFVGFRIAVSIDP